MTHQTTTTTTDRRAQAAAPVRTHRYGRHHFGRQTRPTFPQRATPLLRYQIRRELLDELRVLTDAVMQDGKGSGATV